MIAPAHKTASFTFDSGRNGRESLFPSNLTEKRIGLLRDTLDPTVLSWRKDESLRVAQDTTIDLFHKFGLTFTVCSETVIASSSTIPLSFWP